MAYKDNNQLLTEILDAITGGGSGGKVEDVTLDGISIVVDQIAKIVTDNEVTETSTSKNPIQTQAVAQIYKLINTAITQLAAEIAKKQDALPDTKGDAFYRIKVKNGVITYEEAEHNLVPFSLTASDWVAEVNPVLGTNYKATKTIECNANDALQVYYDLQSLKLAKELNINAVITGANTLSFYAEEVPTGDITGRFEVLKVSPTDHTMTAFTLETTDWEVDVNAELGTFFKAIKTVTCKTNDALQVYFDLSSLKPANEAGVVSEIAGENTICFRSQEKPTVGINGRLEIISADEHSFLPFSIPTTSWIAEADMELETNYKVNLTGNCRIEDALQVYFDTNSLAPANAAGVVIKISDKNTISLYAESIPDTSISGRLEIIRDA